MPRLHLRSLLALALALILASPVSQALPRDREQPIHISADQAMRDEKAGLTVYSGHVVFVQGTLKITADKVTVFQTEDGNGKIVANGQPARMQQQPEIDEELMHAEALIIEYYEDEDRVHLQSNARIRQGGSTVTGETIDYYISDQLVKAGSDVTKENSRVKVVIPASAIDKKEENDDASKRK